MLFSLKKIVFINALKKCLDLLILKNVYIVINLAKLVLIHHEKAVLHVFQDNI